MLCGIVNNVGELNNQVCIDIQINTFLIPAVARYLSWDAGWLQILVMAEFE